MADASKIAVGGGLVLAAGIVVATAGLGGAFAAGAITRQAVSVAGTLLLVLVTLTYAVLTYGLVVETRRSRRQAVRPVIELVTDQDNVTTRFKNVGNGPARTGKLTVRLRDENGSNGTNEQLVTINDLATGQTHVIRPEPFDRAVDNTTDVADRYTHFDVEGTVTDAFGTNHEVDRSYALADIGTDQDRNDPVAIELRRLRQTLVDEFELK